MLPCRKRNKHFSARLNVTISVVCNKTMLDTEIKDLEDHDQHLIAKACEEGESSIRKCESFKIFFYISRFNFFSIQVQHDDCAHSCSSWSDINWSCFCQVRYGPWLINQKHYLSEFSVKKKSSDYLSHFHASGIFPHILPASSGRMGVGRKCKMSWRPLGVSHCHRPL